MANKEITDDFASIQEIAEALTSLSTVDLLRLKQIAKLRSAGMTVMNWEDLFNEAIVRSLGGSRRWPRSVPFVAFFAQTMRSVASEEWRRVDQGQSILESEMNPADSDVQLTLADIGVNPIHPEREIIARNTLRDIEAMFSGDVEVLAILHGLAQGLAPDEIQSASGLTATGYASAQRRIRRRLGRSFLAKEGEK